MKPRKRDGFFKGTIHIFEKHFCGTVRTEVNIMGWKRKSKKERGLTRKILM
jgi:hypothetical protein